MSDTNEPIENSPDGSGQPPQGPEKTLAPRSASVRFGDGGGGPANDGGPGLDAANQSLMDALRITFRLLQAGMAVIVLLYLFSGFQSIGEGERGLRIRFGQITAQDLEPGFQFAWPYPIGELVKIQRSAAPLDEERAFWPEPNSDGAPRTIQQLARVNSLDPGRNGSVITADGNIAHTRWRITYYRADPELYAENVHPDFERRIVNNAVRSAVVTTIGSRTIDELIKDAERVDGTTPARQARQLTQAKLDALRTGITIETMDLLDKIPPKALIEDFDGVQTAEATANERVTEAEQYARLVLTRTAGTAAETLIDRIDRYGREIELGDERAAAGTLDEIRAIMLREQTVGQGLLVSGEVSQILNSATQDASTIVNERRGDAARYAAISEQYEANPLLTLQNAWAQQFSAFMNKPNVISFTLPAGTPFEVFLNQDPQIAKDIERQRNQRESSEAQEQRRQQLRENAFRRGNN